MLTIHGSFEITQYLTALDHDMGSLEGTPEFRISLYGSPIKGQIEFALLRFFKEDYFMYGKGEVVPEAQVLVNLSYAEYQNCVDMLRHEKPMYFHYIYDQDDTGKTAIDPKKDTAKLRYFALTAQEENVGGRNQ